MVNFFKRHRKIPPPQPVPPPPHKQGQQTPPSPPGIDNPDQLMVPFALVDTPRVILDYIAHRDDLPEDLRDLAVNFLLAYRQALGMYLLMAHGPNGVHQANEITENLKRSFEQQVAQEFKSAQDEFFKNLEEQMRKPDEGPEDGENSG